MKLCVVDLTVNIKRGHFYDYLCQFLKKISSEKSDVQEITIVSELDKVDYLDCSRKKDCKFQIIKVASFFDFFFIFFAKRSSLIRKNKLIKLFFYQFGLLAYFFRAFKLCRILRYSIPEKCIFTYMSDFFCIEIPVLFLISLLAPSSVEYGFIYHAISDFSQPGLVKKNYRFLLTKVYKLLKKKKVTIYSHSQGILDFFKKNGFSTQLISYNEIEGYANYRQYTTSKARELLSLPEEIPMFLSFGVLSSKSKNTHALIEAVDSVTSDCRLIISADPLDKLYYEEIEKQLHNVRHRHRFICNWKRLPEDRMMVLFNSVDAVVIPYNNTAMYSKNKVSSGPFWQALAAGKPVIMTAFNLELVEIVLSNNIGLIVNGYTSDALCETLEDFIHKNMSIDYVKVNNIYQQYLINYNSVF